MQITEVLNQFGLQNKENDVYLACLELGFCSVNDIAKKTDIKRTTVYDVLANLGKKGLIGEKLKNKKRLFYAEDPENLIKVLEEKKQRLAEIMPMLKSLQNTGGKKPVFKHFEGDNVVEEVFNDTLKYEGDQYICLKNDIFEDLDKVFQKSFLAKNRKINNKIKLILKEGIEKDNFINMYDEKVRIAYILKEEFLFSTEMLIYGNCVAYIFNNQKMGVIIESTEIVNNMRTFFKLAWKGLK